MYKSTQCTQYMYMYIIMYMCRDATEDKDFEHSEQPDSCGPPKKRHAFFKPHG